MIDVAFVLLGIALGFTILYWSFRISPASKVYCLVVYLFMSWLSFIIVTLSIWGDWWDFTSPSLGWGWSILLTNILYYPPYAVAQALLLRGFWYNMALTLAVSSLLSLNEYLILKFGTFVQYHNWSNGLTFLSYLIPFSLVWFFAILLKKHMRSMN